MRLKISENLRTANLKLKFTGFYKSKNNDKKKVQIVFTI